jgi:hypothetical protein
MALTLHGTVSDNTVALDRKTATPLIINGDMAISQRGTSFTSQTGVAYHLDRYEISAYNVGDGVYRVDQSTDVPTGQGFINSNKVSCTTADTSQDANNQMYFQTQLEGTSTSLLNYFVASPDTITIAFWVRANRTGSYSFALKLSDNGSVENNSATRIYHKLYSISSANTWEKKVLSITLDSSTSETKVTGTGFAVALQFWLGAGTSRDGVTADQWADNSNATATSDNLDLLGSTSNDWYITGVQLEVGTYDANSIPDFQFEDRATSLARCQRYFERISTNGTTNEIIASGVMFTATQFRGYFQFSVVKRAAPSVTFGDTSLFLVQTSATAGMSGFTNNGTNLRNGGFFATTTSSLTAGHGAVFLGRSSGATSIDYDSEL